MSARDDGRPSGLAGAGGQGLPTAAPVEGRDVEPAIGDCAFYCADGRRPGRVALGDAVRRAEDADGFVWIGLRQPTAEAFAEVAQALGLPALAVEDAVRAHQRPKLELYDGVVFAVLKPVRYQDRAEVIETAEIAVFLGERFVVTVRHGGSDVLARVRRELDGAGPQAALLSHGPAAVLYRAADLVVDQYEDVASSIDVDVDVDVDEIEAQVFGGDESDHAQRVYKLKREVLEFRRAAGPLVQPLLELAGGTVPGVPAALGPFFRDVHDHAIRAAERIDGHDRMLTDVLSADLAQVSIRQTRTAVQQNETCAGSARGPRSRWSRRRSPGSTA